MVLSFSYVSAATSVEVLIYTGKISVTSQNDNSTTYAMPQKLTGLPTNTIIECIDGMAIFKVGEVQVVLGESDKLQLSSTDDSEKVNMICLSGEIEALCGEDFFKMDQGQKLGLTNEGMPIIEKAKGIDAPKLGTRGKLSSPAIMSSDPDEAQYTSPHI
jgi:hypothetical protein